jgi:hypothetical protein
VIDASKYFARQSFVDAGRMAIFGQSRGGMVTLLAIEREPGSSRRPSTSVGLADSSPSWPTSPNGAAWRPAKENPSFKGKTPDENLPRTWRSRRYSTSTRSRRRSSWSRRPATRSAPWELHSGRLIDALKARGKVHESKIYENAAGGHVFTDGDTEESNDAKKRIFEFIGQVPEAMRTASLVAAVMLTACTSIPTADPSTFAPPADCEARVGYDRDRVMSGYILPTAAGPRTCIPFSTVAAYPPAGYKGDFYVDEFSDERYARPVGGVQGGERPATSG